MDTIPAPVQKMQNVLVTLQLDHTSCNIHQEMEVGYGKLNVKPCIL